MTDPKVPDAPDATDPDAQAPKSSGEVDGRPLPEPRGPGADRAQDDDAQDVAADDPA
jgi:hypothetical protein